jgi:hypothetical protein
MSLYSTWAQFLLSFVLWKKGWYFHWNSLSRHAGCLWEPVGSSEFSAQTFTVQVLNICDLVAAPVFSQVPLTAIPVTGGLPTGSCEGLMTE